jgi:Leucine-rich repeat (LRR) protein
VPLNAHADCTELYLGDKGIEQLAGFERLTNLEVLWLNDNKLTAITGLDSNVRIKQLYAHVSCCAGPYLQNITASKCNLCERFSAQRTASLQRGACFVHKHNSCQQQVALCIFK